MLQTMNSFSKAKDATIILYHGSTVKIDKPRFDWGREDNDYGRGFYTTQLYAKAASWAKAMGDKSSIVNKYEIDCSRLNVMNLDEFGPLAWIAEIAAHRPIRSELSEDFLPDFVDMYKVDTSDADIIIGYRADDSYTDVIAAFCDGLLNSDEVQRLFYKGNLGEQYFIKSKKAFNLLNFVSCKDVSDMDLSAESMLEVTARTEVFKFINQRRLALAKRFQVPPITIIDAVTDHYVWNKEFGAYEVV